MMTEKRIKQTYDAIRPQPGAEGRMQQAINRKLGRPMSEISVTVKPRRNLIPMILGTAAVLLLVIAGGALLLWPQLRGQRLTAPLTEVEQYPVHETPSPTPENSAYPAPFDPDEYLPLYQSVLDQYRRVLTAADVDDAFFDNGEISILVRNFFDRDPLRRVGWALSDLDYDGVPELVIGTVENEEFYGNILFDVYTLADGQPIRLAQSMERDRWYFIQGKLLVEIASGGAGYTQWTVWNLENGALSFHDGLTQFVLDIEEGVHYAALSWVEGETVPGRELTQDEAEWWIELFESGIVRLSFTPFDTIDRSPELTPEPDQQALSERDRLRINQMYDDLAAAYASGETRTLSLSQWADRSPDGIVQLCGAIGRHAEVFCLSYENIFDLLLVNQDLDGANAEAYAAMLAKIHRKYPAQLDMALANYTDQFGVSGPTDLLRFAEPGFSLDEELPVVSQIYGNTQSIVRLQWGEEYTEIAPETTDMQLRLGRTELADGVIWQFDGAEETWAWTLHVPLSTGTAEIYFDGAGAPIGHWYTGEGDDQLPAPDWTLQCRVQSNELYQTSVPPMLAAALENELAQQKPLDGMETEWVEGWGTRYAAGAEVLPVWLAPSGEQFNYSDCMQRNAEGLYGINGVEADAAIRAILNWLGQETRWRVHADNADFVNLVSVELYDGADCVWRMTGEEHIKAFEDLMQNGMYTVADASKTPNERIELRATTVSGDVLTLLLDPESPRLWIPPFGYYRYNAFESTEVRPMLDALGLDDWPEALQTVDYAAVRESYERLQPRPGEKTQNTANEQIGAPSLSVENGTFTIKPYPVWRSAEQWMDGKWITASATPIREVLEEHEDEFPSLTLDDCLSVSCGGGIRYLSLFALEKPDGKPVFQKVLCNTLTDAPLQSTVEGLSELLSGRYLCYFGLACDGVYIESEGRSETRWYEYYFYLEI